MNCFILHSHRGTRKDIQAQIISWRVSIRTHAVRLSDGAGHMKYILLVHHDEESFRRRPEPERQQMIQESVQLAQQLHASGHYLGAAPLHPTLETTCVRVRDGKQTVTDGPFAETREQLGGYFLINAENVDEAIG